MGYVALMVTARFKRFVLRILQDSSIKDGLPLSDLLTNLRNSSWSSLRGGQIRATSGNGHSVEFSAPGDFTQFDGAELSQEFTELYDVAVNFLQLGTSLTQNGTLVPSPDDTAIFAEMQQRLNAVKFLRSDFSVLNPHL